jgi:uncharacterized DUF497 family protein
MDFQWDEHNSHKLASHGVQEWEAVDVFYGPTIRSAPYNVHGETRYDTIGETRDGRILQVVHTIRADWIRVVNAFTPNRKDCAAFKRRYRHGK